MATPASIEPQILDLEAHIDDLEQALSPLLSTPLPQSTSTLPLLDRAKLYILSAYAIESLLFSTLQVSGQDAKSHAIFQELARLKGYFGKVKSAELGDVPRTRVDTEAAKRFIRHGLSGNERFDREREERVAREKARAALRRHTKFEDGEGEVKGTKRGVEAVEDEDEDEDDSEDEDEDESGGVEHAEDEQDADATPHDLSTENEELYGPTSSSNAAKKHKKKQNPDDEPSTSKKAKASHKPDKKQSKKPKHAPTSTSTSTPSTPNTPTTEDAAALKSGKRARRREQKGRLAADAFETGEAGAEQLIPAKGAPRTHGETFKALLEGSAGKKDGKGKGKGRR